MIFTESSLLQLRKKGKQKAPSKMEGAFNINEVFHRINQFRFVKL